MHQEQKAAILQKVTHYQYGKLPQNQQDQKKNEKFPSSEK